MRKHPKVFPTKIAAPAFTPISRAAIAVPLREKPPDIYIRVPKSRAYSSFTYTPARWRIKHGYAHLAWREGKRVRTFYIGKAKKNFPTHQRPDLGGAVPQLEEIAGKK
jgi:hypothetical protein